MIPFNLNKANVRKGKFGPVKDVLPSKRPNFVANSNFEGKERNALAETVFVSHFLRTDFSDIPSNNFTVQQPLTGQANQHSTVLKPALNGCVFVLKQHMLTRMES